MHKNLFKIFSILLCLVLCFNISAFASEDEIINEETSAAEEITEMSDEELIINNEKLFGAIEEEYSKLEEDINANKNELDSVNSDINDNVNRLAIINSEVDILNNQIKLLNSELSTLNLSITVISRVYDELIKEIDDLTASIEETDKKIKETEPELRKATDEVHELIRNEYMDGEISYIEFIFNSGSLEEYYVRKELFNRVKEDKTEKMNKFAALNKQLTEEKEKMEKEKAVLENDRLVVEEYNDKYNESIKRQEAAQKDLINKKSEVTERKNEVKDIISELDTESEIYKQQIQRDRAEMEYLSVYVDNYISEHGSQLNDIPDVEFENTGEMIWPVSFNSYLTATYPAYSDGSPHWGIDICAEGGNSYGRPFNAAQGGIVILAVNDNNYNSGFGNYCVVDHGDGTSTLYAHARNLVVSRGDVVRQGETLGYIGSTGNVTGPHLHFEVRVKNSDGDISRVNPLNYVKNA